MIVLFRLSENKCIAHVICLIEIVVFFINVAENLIVIKF